MRIARMKPMRGVEADAEGGQSEDAAVVEVGRRDGDRIGEDREDIECDVEEAKANRKGIGVARLRVKSDEELGVGVLRKADVAEEAQCRAEDIRAAKVGTEEAVELETVQE